MAQDNVRVVCEWCGKRTLVNSVMGEGFQGVVDPLELAEFVTEHIQNCHPLSGFGGDLGHKVGISFMNDAQIDIFEREPRR